MARRSKRVFLDIPVVVRGKCADGSPFQEETFTMLVSAHGALLMLATNVEVGQMLALVNPQSREEREVRVAYVGSPHAGMAEVGIEFVRPSPEFWPVQPPPEDWG